MTTQGISIALHDSLLQIANLASNDNISAEEKNKKISQLTEPILIMLENNINQVGGTRRKLLEELKGIVESGDWATLPDPVNMNLTLEKLDRIGFSIQDAKNNLTTDMESILRLLLEIMRKSMLENKLHQTVQHQADINAAIAAKIARKKANDKQLSSDLSSSIAQGIAAAVGIAGSAVSISFSIHSFRAGKKALAESVGNAEKGIKSISALEVARDNQTSALKKMKKS